MIKQLAKRLKNPCYILEEKKLEDNLKILKYVKDKSNAKILLALKGFAFWSSFKMVAKYLDGITASGYYEARLGLEEFRKYNKNAIISVFSPAFKQKDIKKLTSFSNHIIFNSFNQMYSYKHLLKKNVEIGLRINPMYSEVKPDIYNPCIEGSRLGINPKEFKKALKTYSLENVSGLHFHTHCEQNSDVLKRTLEYVVKYFGNYINQMKWINFGGGHHITRKDYDLKLLIDIIKDFKAEFKDIDVYLEPGEAVGWKCGVLVGEVVDIINNKFNIAIVDLSAATHMPDCLEMPYTPEILDSKIINLNDTDLKLQNLYKYPYRLGSPSCLSGDIIGDYAFKKKLKIGDKIIIQDMIHYTIVKNNTFNGIPLPYLGILKKNGKFKIVKRFNYDDYKRRNG
ncbi:carboxynorspermidine decarboxylase [Helicobacter sp. MIT 14-3879]|uniref:carboxynorspermidine decarboxylase n=1 Tax=Helicobacter sp. MIT 14-3879 TaxID=2040649 RepID=UPI000E1F7218|nr:carboxynorspermidine decarboxylase [Helicobacter sp. MIT 14-3879]RDU64184.1 carboxynorspermidine decarboxylase [Helicobacter sp. MIT 14-3879]